jgi:hypothetical protein
MLLVLHLYLNLPMSCVCCNVPLLIWVLAMYFMSISIWLSEVTLTEFNWKHDTMNTKFSELTLAQFCLNLNFFTPTPRQGIKLTYISQKINQNKSWFSDWTRLVSAFPPNCNKQELPQCTSPVSDNCLRRHCRSLRIDSSQKIWFTTFLTYPHQEQRAPRAGKQRRRSRGRRRDRGRRGVPYGGGSSFQSLSRISGASISCSGGAAAGAAAGGAACARRGRRHAPIILLKKQIKY